MNAPARKTGPLATVKAKFGDKEKLVAAVKEFTTDDLWVSRTNKDKGLDHVSNAKLLRLHATFSAVKEQFGSRAKLIDAILELEKRTKDEGYKTRLSAYPVPRLYDLFRSTKKRTQPKTKATTAEKKAAAAKKPAAAPKKAAPKKAAAKSPAAKKAAAKKKK
ncbi:hypothetical protein LVJ94_42240 [Pendulispora rubella]|uniref:Uncharacterized protein n=1 Tax=Pendulispora rubella TaxID=2741070 RepID=A0ABZ2KYD2_9BACT